MLTVNYITRPYFFDISLELIRELKKEVRLNYILVISERYFDFFGIKDPEAFRSGSVFHPEQIFSDQLFRRCQSCFEGVNVLCKYETHKESRFKNALLWRRLVHIHPSVLKADLHLIETLNLGDWYFLYKIRRKRKFHIVHDPVAHTGEKRRRMDMVRKFYFPFIDRYLTYSNYASVLFKDSYKKYQDLVTTLALPVYDAFPIQQEQPNGSKKNKIVFFGRISPYKGAEIFYKAACLLAKDFPELQFVIAGKTIPDYAPEFIRSNVHPNIIIKNEFVSPEELAGIMNSAMFCVLPYLDATQSGVIMTSYAYDVPVLVSNCPGLVEYCLDADKFSFEKANVDDLSRKMRVLLSDLTLIDNYKRRIDNYRSANISKENTRKILEQV